MTDDYKQELVEWLSGVIIDNSGKSYTDDLSEIRNFVKPSFNEATFTDDTSIYDAVSAVLGTDSVITPIETLAAKNTNNEYTGYSILYGNYTLSSNDSERYGFISIISPQFKHLQTLTTFESGTGFGQFLKLNVAEDGRLYGLDISNNKIRFILLNNPSLSITSEYQCILRNSYYCEGNIANIDIGALATADLISVEKSPTDARYLLTYANGVCDSSSNILMTLLKIQVSSTNEWIDYNTSTTLDFTSSWRGFYPKNIIVEWETDDVLASLKGIAYRTSNKQYEVLEYVKGEGSSYLGQNIIDTDLFTTLFNDIQEEAFNYGTEDNFYIYSISFYNYYIFGTTYTKDTNVRWYLQYAYRYRDSGSWKLKVGTFNKGTIDYISDSISYLNYLHLWRVNDILAGYSYLPTQESATLGQAGNIYYILLDTFEKNTAGDLIERYAINQVSGSYYERYSRQFYVYSFTNTFNLYSYTMYYNDFDEGYGILKSTIKYDPNSINNNLYKNYSQEIQPLFANIYSNNDELIFSRNLTNLTVTGNTVQATTEVPNTILNDSSIIKDSLIAKSYTDIINETRNVDKNIYETLYYNYAMAINIEDRNQATYRSMPITSQQLAQAIQNPNTQINGEYIYTYLNIYSGDAVLQALYTDGTTSNGSIEQWGRMPTGGRLYGTIYTLKDVSEMRILLKNGEKVILNGNWQKYHFYQISDDLLYE